MIAYVVFMRILGGDWTKCPFPDGRWETEDLAEALGLAATVKDAIREAMVVSITTQAPLPSDFNVVTKQYEIVE